MAEVRASALSCLIRCDAPRLRVPLCSHDNGAVTQPRIAILPK